MLALSERLGLAQLSELLTAFASWATSWPVPPAAAVTKMVSLVFSCLATCKPTDTYFVVCAACMLTGQAIIDRLHIWTANWPVLPAAAVNKMVSLAFSCPATSKAARRIYLGTAAGIQVQMHDLTQSSSTGVVCFVPAALTGI